MLWKLRWDQIPVATLVMELFQQGGDPHDE